jgi:methionyl-tRNA formyltransferase
MRIIFAGTPDFAAHNLKALLTSEHTICAIYTQPDRPAGRGRKLTASPVKQIGLDNNIPVEQPDNFKQQSDRDTLAAYQADLMIVVAYGLLLPQAVLDTPSFGCINIHASLLPRWRGAAPIQRAILAGDDETGVCIMQMEAGLDTGPVIARAHCPIHDNDTTQQLHDRLAQLGAETLLNTLPDLTSLQQHAEVQNHQLSTYATKLQKTEANIDWQNTAKAISRQVHAFNPWPIAQTQWQQKTFRIWSAEEINPTYSASPGQVLQADKNGIDIACGQGVLRVTEIQLPGKRAMSVSNFLNANTLPIGEQLG